MIHARRHESGISPSRASRSGPAVSCFFLGLHHALFSLLAFFLPSLPSFLSSVPPSTAFRLVVPLLPFTSLLSSFLFWIFHRRVSSSRLPPHFLSFCCASSLPFSSLLDLTSSILYLHFFTYAVLFHAWPTARNRKSYREIMYIHRPSALLSSRRLSFSLCVTP